MVNTPIAMRLQKLLQQLESSFKNIVNAFVDGERIVIGLDLFTLISENRLNEFYDALLHIYKKSGLKLILAITPISGLKHSDNISFQKNYLHNTINIWIKFEIAFDVFEYIKILKYPQTFFEPIFSFVSFFAKIFCYFYINKEIEANLKTNALSNFKSTEKQLALAKNDNPQRFFNKPSIEKTDLADKDKQIIKHDNQNQGLFNKIKTTLAKAIPSTNTISSAPALTTQYLSIEKINKEDFEPLDFPFDNAQTPEIQNEFPLVNFSLTTQVLQKLRTVAKQNNATIADILLTCYQCFLFLITHKENFAVDLRQDLINQILPVKMTYSDKISQLIKKTILTKEHLSKTEHVFLNSQDTNVAFEYMELIVKIQRKNPTNGFDLILCFLENDNHELFQCYFKYDPNHFKKETIEHYTDLFLTLLTQIAYYPEKKIGDIKFLTQPEELSLTQWTTLPSTKPKYLPLPRVFEDIVKKFPDKIAVQYENETACTYQELNRRANLLAHYLLNDVGVKPREFVAVCLKRSLDMIVAILAVLKAGCAVACFGAKNSKKEEMEIKINVANPAAIIVQKETYSLLPSSFSKPVVFADKFSYDFSNTELADTSPKIEILPEDLALLGFTSGTSGLPKGVLVPHAGWHNWILFMKEEIGITCDDKVFSGCSADFDAFFWEIFCLALGHGATLYLNQDELQHDLQILKLLFKRYQITVTTFTPTVLSILNPIHYTSLKRIFSIGEKLPERLIRSWLQEKIQIYNGYGPTEVTAGVTIYPCTLSSCDKQIVGKSISNMAIYILNNDRKPVPINVWGEIYISGVGVAKGYLNNPKETEKAFLKDPFNSGFRMYKTGDRARYTSNGNIEFAGRIGSSRQIKRLGERIELDEIESMLLRHPQIAQVAVKAWGSEQKQFMAAYIVPKADTTMDSVTTDDSLAPTMPSPDEMTNFLTKAGFSKAKIPSIFIKMDSLPLTSNGKLNVRALEKPTAPPENESKIESEISPTEKQIYRIWKDIFDFRNILFDDKFCELGGNSILFVEMIDKLNQAFFDESEFKLYVTSIPEDVTIRQLALTIEQLRSRASDALVEPKTEQSALQNNEDEEIMQPVQEGILKFLNGL